MTIETKYNVGDEVWWFGKYKFKIEAIFTVSRGKEVIEEVEAEERLLEEQRLALLERVENYKKRHRESNQAINGHGARQLTNGVNHEKLVLTLLTEAT